MNSADLANDHTFHTLLQDAWKARKDKGLLAIRIDALMRYVGAPPQGTVTPMMPRVATPQGPAQLPLPPGYDPFTEADGAFVPLAPAIQPAAEDVDAANIQTLAQAMDRGGRASGAARIQARINSNGDFPVPEANRLLEKMGSPYRAQNQFLEARPGMPKDWVLDLVKTA